MGNFAISEELKNAFHKANIDYCELHHATAEEFHEAVKVFKKNHAYGAFVTLHSVDEYRDMKLLLSDDGTAGIAITQDNNIVSVFNSGTTRKGILKTLIPVAIECGGNKLDNYNSEKLSGMYELYGFNPVSKVKFEKRFAPDDWNYERDGEPDVIFWIHNGDSAKNVVLNFGKYVIPWDSVQEFLSYDEAGSYRDKLLEKIKNGQI